jgi:hypothetical protein
MVALLVLITCMAMIGLSVCFARRLSPLLSLLIGLACWTLAAMVWLVSREFAPTSYTWTPVLLPWCACISTGAAFLLVGAARLAHSKPRSD